MRLLKGMMVCMAALFMLGYVNSCDSAAEAELTQVEQTSELETTRN